eukprot:TRINITY_DN14280_c1_g1_i1.p1 TRINITY_DN14280_c1_g1~~TRINITY_DN14280_c1_g1_i1.p1  ORF type:complete len:567 (+),score=81.99 TRINITY_DN14280_c1_g1_i1:154-1854(+)
MTSPGHRLAHPCGELQTTPLQQVEKKYGHDVKQRVQATWQYRALPIMTEDDKKMMSHFLSLREQSPQGPGSDAHDDIEEEHLLEMVCKLILFAPTRWFKIVTGQDCPKECSDDFTHIGVAFDASSRLRRAGISYYHRELAKLSKWSGTKTVYHVGQEGMSEGVFVDLAQDSLPGKRPQMARIVAVGCTHLWHEHVHLPSSGDVLVHAGDMSYEESRSVWKAKFEKFMQLGDVSGVATKSWLQRENAPLGWVLQWLSSIPGFRRKVIIGGNHDFILEQLDKLKVAKELCLLYGVQYLRTEDAPLCFPEFPLRIWGSGMSGVSQVGANRAVLSGNTAFQIQADDTPQFDKATEHLKEGEVDVMVMHGPPADAGVQGKKGSDLSSVKALVSRIRPKVFICAHAHNPDVIDSSRGRMILIDDSKVVNCACSGTWNQPHGTAVVIDIDLHAYGPSSAWPDSYSGGYTSAGSPVATANMLPASEDASALLLLGRLDQTKPNVRDDLTANEYAPAVPLLGRVDQQTETQVRDDPELIVSPKKTLAEQQWIPKTAYEAAWGIPSGVQDLQKSDS